MFSEIVFLCSSANIGDRASSQALLNEFSKKMNITKTYTIDTSKDFDLLSKEYTSISSKNFVFAVGEKSLDFLQYLNQHHLLKNDESFIAASIHQYDNNLNNLPLSYISIPEAVINTEEKKQIIYKIPASTLTFSVPTLNPNIETLKQSYDSWNIYNKPNLNDDHIIIMLPGDAPDKNNKIHYFTKNSAKQLFDDVRLLWKQSGSKHKIIVHNGPRTGKYDENSGELSSDHEEDKIDKISEYFINLLKSSEMEFSFFNFKFEVEANIKKSVSVFNQLLYIAQTSNKDNYFIIPGESVSMLNQISLYVKSDKAIVFKSSSMNEEHEIMFNSAFNHSYVSYFEDQSKRIITPEHPTKRDGDDVTQIVHDVIESFQMSGDCRSPSHHHTYY